MAHKNAPPRSGTYTKQSIPDTSGTGKMYGNSKKMEPKFPPDDNGGMGMKSMKGMKHNNPKGGY